MVILGGDVWKLEEEQWLWVVNWNGFGQKFEEE